MFKSKLVVLNGLKKEGKNNKLKNIISLLNQIFFFYRVG